MIALFPALALLLQSQAPDSSRPTPSLDSLRRVVHTMEDTVEARRVARRAARRNGGDTTAFIVDSAMRARLRHAREAVDSARRLAKRIPLTPALMATAFADDAARALYQRAQKARLQHDSSLQSYDATTYSRISVGMGFARIGRERLLFRAEESARVRWKRDVGAWVDVTGSRAVAPALDGVGKVGVSAADIMSPVPYYPGRDALWIGSETSKANVDENDIIHPLASGAEAYYHFQIGDSMSFRLQDGRAIRLVELEFRARKPQWNLTVGSLWFDVDKAELVRAAYRLSEPIDVWRMVEEEDPGEMDDIPMLVRPAISPIIANISAISIEYGLHEGRFWLPRAQLAQGDARVGFMRVPFRFEERFQYASVNALTSLEAIPAPRAADDSATRDSASAERAAEDGATISIGIGDDDGGNPPGDSTARRPSERERQCAIGTVEQRSRDRYENTLRVGVRVPCDTAALARSPDLPPSIYDAGDQLFGRAELDALVEETLGLSDQSAFAPQRPTLHWGFDLLRYNRVEGLSAGIQATQRLGAGYTATAIARLGTGDLSPNGELTLARGNGRRTIQVTGYRRLDAANDWGNPLGFGASLSALLFGRDEGFYYRTWGAEFAGSGEGNPLVNWRFFAERHGSAERETHFSLARAISGHRLPENIGADEGTFIGSAMRLHGSRGADPHGWRLLGDLRLEGAAGKTVFARAAADLTVSHGLGRWADGALTFGAGRASGELPVQRLWYMGGSQTVRGQPAGAQRGDAYWLGHAELGSSFVGARPVIFADLGWAGDRRDWRHPGLPLSGAGAGVSFVDGLVRFDLARGINPTRGWRGILYVEARF